MDLKNKTLVHWKDKEGNTNNGEVLGFVSYGEIFYAMVKVTQGPRKSKIFAIEIDKLYCEN